MSDTHINLFGGSPLNRLSWLRPSQIFLDAASTLPSTRWVVFNGGRPLVSAPRDALSRISLAYLSTSDVQPFIGNRPWFGQSKDGALITKEEASHHTEAARHLGPPIVFLGLEETDAQSGNALPSSDFTDPATALDKLHGTPYFALDVGDLGLPDATLQETVNAAEARLSLEVEDERKLSWAEPRALMAGMDIFEGGVYAEARSMVDWNSRNKFCPGCGARTYSMWGGWKIACSTLLPWADNSGRKPCPTTRGLHNFTHPRTDPVVIMIAIDETGDKILLGRNKKFPGKFYSALAGFMEPGESFEDAVAREMWEEAGVKVWSVKYHSSQPWPYPANLMVGCYARADASQPLRIDLDNELEDARWYTRAEILAVLNHPFGAYLSNRDNRKLTELVEGQQPKSLAKTAGAPQSGASGPPQSGASVLAHSDPDIEPDSHSEVKEILEDPPFQVPPYTAIAGVLIRDWAEGKISYPKASSAL
ncbi:NUDIX hydrolase domain-like protein [Schizophyllum commune]